MISRLHAITQENLPGISALTQAENACKGGCKWIQLRSKTLDLTEWEVEALQLKKLCDSFRATFIINDNPELVKKIDASGVHLGKEDMPVLDARKILGPDKIIGGTANTLEDVIKHFDDGANYVGLGPFRFTETKKNLSPIIGIDGYKAIIEELRKRNINIPIIAIGGIQTKDIPEILKTGIHGVAIASLINKAQDPVKTTTNILSTIDVELKR